MKATVIFVMCAVTVGTIYSQVLPLPLPTNITLDTIAECIGTIKCVGCFAPVCGLVVQNTSNTSSYYCFGNQNCYDMFNATCAQHGVFSMSPANMSSCAAVNSTCAVKELALQCPTTPSTTTT